MLDIGWSELLVIGIVALVVIGPKELPTVLRKMGQGVGKLRRMAGEFQGQFNEALREAELSDLKDNISGLKSDLGSLASDAQKSIAKAIPTNPLHDIEDSLKAPTGPVENKELPAADVEAQLPPPSELEPHPFETIEEEVRAATDKLTPAAAEAPRAAGAKPAGTKSADAARPRRAPRRKAAPTVEPEVAEAVADLDRPAAQPRSRGKAKPKPGTVAPKAAATRTSSARTRIARKPGRSVPGDEGPAA